MSSNNPKTQMMTIQQAFELALKYRQGGRLADAEKLLRQILTHQPQQADALHLLAAVVHLRGRSQEALELIQQAIKINPHSGEYFNTRGIILSNSNHPEAAIEAFHEAFKLKPDYAEAHSNLGNVFKKLERLDEAIDEYRIAIKFKPDLADSYNNMGHCLKDQGRIQESLDQYKIALRIKPDDHIVLSNLILAMHYHPGIDALSIYHELRRWNHQFAEPLKNSIKPCANSRDPERKLRIGYVSPDLSRHVVGCNLLPLFSARRRELFEIFCYSSVKNPDHITELLHGHADVWRDILSLNDAQAAQMIRDDKIDILVDLSLHTGDNRLLIFACKPAPVQVTWLGYPGSTGMEAMDYRFSDPYLDPPETDLSVYSEQTLRLPETYWCYQPGGSAPESAPLPALSAGFVTFGCLNNFAKVSPAAQELWLEILKKVPQSRLILHSRPGAHLNAIRERFIQNQIAPERWEFLGYQDWTDYINTYNRIDIGLDPFPYNGGITTCDSLFMGVPVITLVGQTAVGRAGKSLLSNVGLPELIAQTPEEYVDIVVKLADDLPRLAEIRRTLRQRMEASPLMDAQRFAGHVEAAYRQMWRQWTHSPQNRNQKTGSGTSVAKQHIDAEPEQRLGSEPPTMMQLLGTARAHLDAGRLDQAEIICRQVLDHHPDQPRAWHLSGRIALQKGQLQTAEDLIRRAISLNPDAAIFYDSLGMVLKTQGRLPEAVQAYQAALKLKPDYAQVHSHLGDVLLTQQQLEPAIQAYHSALHFKPNYAEAHFHLGIALKKSGNFREAIGEYHQALQLKPGVAEVYNNLGNAWHALKEFDQAIDEYRLAIKYKPDYPEAHNNLGIVLLDDGQIQAAMDSYRKAIELKPDFVDAVGGLGNAFRKLGLIKEAVNQYRSALQIDPGSCITYTYSSLIYTLHFDLTSSAQSISKELEIWNQRFARPLKESIGPYGNEPNPDRRLKIGYVSPDFREHAVAYFIENLLTTHDPERFEIFCYADLPRPDQTSNRLRNLVHHWRNITGTSDQQAAELIRADQIDILVDLAGHTGDNRLLLFARKPAPIQVTYLGYPGSTGLETMDYRFTDAFADPPGTADAFYTEKLLRLADCFLCYRPSATAPLAGPPPSSAAGFITFGCFNGLLKINHYMVRLWSQILQRLPTSRMRIKNHGLTDSSGQRHLLELFAECGIGPERLDLHGWIASEIEHLQLYQQMDVALDTFPYHGTTTTCESLYMGIPVVTLAGQAHVSRVGVSLLSNVGLPELIARTPEEYLDIAVKLAGDLPRLAEIRRTLRQRMEASPLMDAKRFASNVEVAYRKMWRTYCTKDLSCSR